MLGNQASCRSKTAFSKLLMQWYKPFSFHLLALNVNMLQTVQALSCLDELRVNDCSHLKFMIFKDTTEYLWFPCTGLMHIYDHGHVLLWQLTWQRNWTMWVCSLTQIWIFMRNQQSKITYYVVVQTDLYHIGVYHSQVGCWAPHYSVWLSVAHVKMMSECLLTTGCFPLMSGCYIFICAHCVKWRWTKGPESLLQTCAADD